MPVDLTSDLLFNPNAWPVRNHIFLRGRAAGKVRWPDGRETTLGSGEVPEAILRRNFVSILT